ncbi:hypothetical protein RhiirA5_500715 [Rhizophagus irregularis]|uniref:HMG box domain-containing protein n=2 Tax=Rhizophagus irregularis TaxID=588596 RepID=A0A2N0PKL1_9GLOM
MTRAIKKACSNESNEDLIKKYGKVLDEVQDTLTITISNGQTPTANELLIKGDSKKPTNSSMLCINHLIKTCGLMDEVRKVEGTSKRTMQITRRLGGILWKRMDCHGPNKLFFIKLAQELRQIHKSKFPNYKPTSKKSAIRQFKFKQFKQFKHVNDHIHIMNDHQIQPNITNPQNYLPQQQQISPQLTQQDFSYSSPYQHEILCYSDGNNLYIF